MLWPNYTWDFGPWYSMNRRVKGTQSHCGEGDKNQFLQLKMNADHQFSVSSFVSGIKIDLC
jgi:hypothetical protein